MEELTRTWHEIIARPDGPFAFRFYLQPIMATIFAIRDGRKDARQNKPAYLWAVFTEKTQRRRELIRDGWQSVGKIFIIAVLIDFAYGLFVLRGVRPVQTLLIATTLAIVPYVVLRGPVNRFSRSRNRERRRPAA
jgi:hypothetical protein